MSDISNLGQRVGYPAYVASSGNHSPSGYSRVSSLSGGTTEEKILIETVGFGPKELALTRMAESALRGAKNNSGSVSADMKSPKWVLENKVNLSKNVRDGKTDGAAIIARLAIFL